MHSSGGTVVMRKSLGSDASLRDSKSKCKKYRPVQQRLHVGNRAGARDFAICVLVCYGLLEILRP